MVPMRSDPDPAFDLNVALNRGFAITIEVQFYISSSPFSKFNLSYLIGTFLK
jgi:hypothetical protein